MSRTAKRRVPQRLTPRQRTYRRQLRDPRWQRKRLEVMARDRWKCRHCGTREKTLHVHHLAYTPGPPWHIPLRLLLTLCLTFDVLPTAKAGGFPAAYHVRYGVRVCF